MNKDSSIEFELYKKIIYFECYFLEYVKIYNKGKSYINLFNLHSTCKNINEEITKNNISRNLKFFQSKLREIIKKDYYAQNNYKYKVDEIINNITSNKEYAFIVVNNLIDEIKDGKYGRQIIDRIIFLFFSDITLTNAKDELKYLAESLIIEYIIYGYSLPKIKDTICNVFSIYSDCEKYIRSNSSMAEDKVNDDIKEYIDNLFKKEKIEELKLLFEQPRNKRYYLYNIKGIVGDSLDIKLNNVNIYNWRTNPKLEEGISCPKPLVCNYEKFEENDIHCCILVESIDDKNIFNNIKQELDNALDILYNYHDIECKIEIDYSCYIVFDENKKMIGEGFTREHDENFKRKISPLNYNYRADIDKLDEKYKKYSEYILKNKNKTSQIIQSSVRYYRKAKETNRLEDKILNYWICIENLFNIEINLPQNIIDTKENDNKFNKICSILPYIILENNIIDEIWLAYFYFYQKYSYEKDSLIKNLNNEDKKKLQFDEKKIKLIEFINNYELLDGILKLDIDKEKYQYYYELLNNNKKIKEYITKDLNKTKETILLLYRYRNMIVHNAQYDITFSNIYEKQFEILVLKLINIVINEYYKCKGRDELKNIIINKYINQIQINKSITESGLKKWLNNK